MTSRAEKVARIAKHFAGVCYLHNYGCVQTLSPSHRVIPVLTVKDVSLSSLSDVELSSYVKHQAQETNRLIEMVVSGQS